LFVLRRGKGISLLELMVVFAIISILALAAIPLFNSFIANYRVSAAADNLYYYLQYARSEAVKRNANVYVSFTSGDTWCYGINVGSSCNCATPNNCSLAAVSYTTAGQTTLSTNGLSSNSIYFEGSHAAASASGSVTFTRYGNSTPLVTVLIGRLGGLQMCSTGMGGYTAC